MRQVPRRISHERTKVKVRGFDYSLDYKILDLRKSPILYRVGIGEQGVLLVQPYKSELLPLWKFKTPNDARRSSLDLVRAYSLYRKQSDFVGMDMARKYLQMGFTRSRRYANHRTGRKYDSGFNLLPFENDTEKAKSAVIFYDAWQAVEADPDYQFMKALWRAAFG